MLKGGIGRVIDGGGGSGGGRSGRGGGDATYKLQHHQHYDWQGHHSFFLFFLVFWTALAWASTWVLGKGSVVEGDLFGLLFEK